MIMWGVFFLLLARRFVLVFLMLPVRAVLVRPLFGLQPPSWRPLLTTCKTKNQKWAMVIHPQYTSRWSYTHISRRARFVLWYYCTALALFLASFFIMENLAYWLYMGVGTGNKSRSFAHFVSCFLCSSVCFLLFKGTFVCNQWNAWVVNVSGNSWWSKHSWQYFVSSWIHALQVDECAYKLARCGQW